MDLTWKKYLILLPNSNTQALCVLQKLRLSLRCLRANEEFGPLLATCGPVSIGPQQAVVLLHLRPGIEPLLAVHAWAVVSGLHQQGLSLVDRDPWGLLFSSPLLCHGAIICRTVGIEANEEHGKIVDCYLTFMSMTPSLWELGAKSLGLVFGKP